MIFFPFLYEDELFYSILARFHDYSGNENPKSSIKEIFGSNTVCATTTLPANLNQLCKRLPHKDSYNPSYFIEKHTLLPYYAPFILKERYTEIKVSMSEENGTALFMRLGRVASTIKSPKYFNYCIECVANEMKTQGEVYWHRTHQVEGVKICPKHRTWLIKSQVPFSERKHKHEFIPLENSIRVSNSVDKVTTSKSDFEHLLYIADQTYYLLNNKIEPLGLENLQKYYLERLQGRGLASVAGRIRWQELISLFNCYYSQEFLLDINCFVDSDKEDTWLHKVLRKPRVSCHPLRHILILGFLGETILSMVSQIGAISYKPFGSGPWLCLNKAADHFQKPIINSCVITRDYKTGLPVGTFSCSCGFVFSRKGPDKTNEDQFKIGRIKEFGCVWKEKLTCLSQTGLSLRAMARILGADPMTIKKMLTSNVEGPQNKSPSRNTEEIQKYREQWVLLLKKNKDKSITQLRSVNPKVYAWLYRNDKDWLKNNYPSTTKVTSNKGITRINWEKRDYEMAIQVEKIIESILSEKNKLIRVTKNEIGRRLGKLTALNKGLEQLPKTKKLINQGTESVEQFQMRRIKYVINEFRKTISSIKEWEVIRKAGLKRHTAEKFRTFILEEIYKDYKNENFVS
ncbi:TnsD family transposase [Ectobacillus polymachus]|uniref:TnsD family transposase n=1 Tax=Ectobacillus polymachus TaxID=1508806 RepID=UPI003A899E56